MKKQKDYSKKFAKRIDALNALIQQAKQDDVAAIEPDSTWESEYIFEKVWIEKNVLKLSYNELYSPTKKCPIVDKVALKLDAERDFEATRYKLNWIKRAIKKGYTAERRSAKKAALNQE